MHTICPSLAPEVLALHIKKRKGPHLSPQNSCPTTTDYLSNYYWVLSSYKLERKIKYPTLELRIPL